MKQSILCDAEHLDKEMIDYGIHIAVDSYNIRKAPELVDCWLKEGAATREVQGESQDSTTRSSATTTNTFDDLVKKILNKIEEVKK